MTSCRRFSRWLLVLAMMVPVAGAVTPAVAASVAVHTAVHVAATPATAHVGSVVDVSGVLSPHKARSLTLERLVGKTWKPLVRGKSGTTGAFSLTLRAGSKQVTWSIRVVAA